VTLDTAFSNHVESTLLKARGNRPEDRALKRCQPDTETLCVSCTSVEKHSNNHETTSKSHYLLLLSHRCV